jgi:putative colanic acid biosysnthesis UDP-glucose lipid carrier transferase
MYAAIWMMMDMTAMIVSAWIACALTSSMSAPWYDWEVMSIICASTLLLLAFTAVGLYGRKLRHAHARAMTRIGLISVLAWAVANRTSITMDMHSVHVFDWLDGWLLCSVLLMAVTRMLFGGWLKRFDRSGRQVRRVVIAGDDAYLRRWLQANRHKLDGYDIWAAYTDDVAQPARYDVPVLENVESLLARAAHRDFDELWLALPMSRQDDISRYVTLLQHHFVDIRLFADMQNLLLFNPSATTLGGTRFIDLVTSPPHQDDAWSKSLFDRVFSLLTLLGLSPLLLLIAVGVKCSSPGPVFFRQRRKGVDGREFTILKFRSMRVHQEAIGQLTQASRNDKRITPIGCFLRKTSLDELPQFINVLLGQMSVVGPRPQAVEHDNRYMQLIDGYMYRYRIKPGITGWAQINGARGETAKVESMAHRVALDLFYIQHWSFWLDLQIVAMTVFKGFRSQNAY